MIISKEVYISWNAKNKKYCRIEINIIDVNALSENKVYSTMLESIGRDKVKIYE